MTLYYFISYYYTLSEEVCFCMLYYRYMRRDKILASQMYPKRKLDKDKTVT